MACNIAKGVCKHHISRVSLVRFVIMELNEIVLVLSGHPMSFNNETRPSIDC